MLLVFTWLGKAIASEPVINGKAYILIDAISGQVLTGKDIHTKQYPASTTKILTAIIALEKGKLTDKVKIGPNPPRVEGTKVYLREGETISLEKLLNAAMIHSANDAALAIAEHIAGSQEKFAKLMNEKAKEIGCKESNFINPHGLSDDNHYTSAYDLSLIAKYAMQNPTFREIVAKRYYDWQGLEWENRLENINRLVKQMPECTGIKSGYTTQANHTLAASASKKDQNLIAIVLGADGRVIWDDTQNLLNYGFNNFDTLNVVKQGNAAATINISKDKNIHLIPTRNMNFTIPKGQMANLEKEIVFKNLSLPIKKGDILGQLVISLNGEEKDRIDLIASEGIKQPINILQWVINIVAGLYILQIVFRFWRQIKRARRKKVFADTSRRISSFRY